ncbi:peptidoglycan-binding domain-containing protein [Lentilitoribacter sp. Alg239-R112]|uniref:peptidoglycan-binding domain-containing protein n=1 Tax=Lentilitoribacter sp. Alg239-R112 TaxID=2305987 RepID=UPI0013A70A23|nr:peptidoglycan-binding domain-containing protein [Lentilitoribacter sp. Alg239-R112]
MGKKINGGVGGVAVGVIGAPIVPMIRNSNKKQTGTDKQKLQRKNEERPIIKAVQSALNMAGFDSGRSDGLFGPKSSKAMKGYQASIGIEETGRLTAAQVACVSNFLDEQVEKNFANLTDISVDMEASRTILNRCLAN